MTALPDLLERAATHFGSLVHRVEPGQWTAPTPCADWSVRDLVNHLVYEASWVEPLLAGRTIAEVGDRFDGDLLGADPAAAWDGAIATATAALTGPDVLDRVVHLSYGDTSADHYLGQLTGDFVVHAWDLARGIGADDRLDPELVEVVHERTAPDADQLAASGLFDPPLPVEADADAQTRLLALFGRRR
jgi:uncharacterized protein (TIGR03086 family)